MEAARNARSPVLPAEERAVAGRRAASFLVGGAAAAALWLGAPPGTAPGERSMAWQPPRPSLRRADAPILARLERTGDGSTETIAGEMMLATARSGPTVHVLERAQFDDHGRLLRGQVTV